MKCVKFVWNWSLCENAVCVEVEFARKCSLCRTVVSLKGQFVCESAVCAEVVFVSKFSLCREIQTQWPRASETEGPRDPET